MTQQQEDLIRELLRQTHDIPLDESAKQQAIQLAMTEFEQSNKKSKFSLQGFSQRFRLMLEPTSGSQSMKQFKRKWVYSGLAAASVAAFSVIVIHQSDGLNIDPVPMVHPGDLSSINIPTSEPELTEPTLAIGNEADKRQDKKDLLATAELDRVHQFETPPQQPPVPITQLKAKNRTEGLAEPNGGLVMADAPEVSFKRMAKAEEASVPFSSLPTAQSPVKQTAEKSSDEQSSIASSGLISSSNLMSAPAPSPDVIITPHDYQGRDQFETVEQSPIKQVKTEPVSTFSIDVDTASYSFVRRQLNQGLLPQKAAVRLEEMVNYFDYDYPMPESRSTPFNTTVSVTDSPWKAGNQLVHIGIKGYKINRSEQPRSNLVFLLDVSGSMSSPDKLPLVKQSMSLLLSQLNPDDTVAIAVYAGAAGTVLEPTPVKNKQTIINALDQLHAGGSTAGAQGIQLAYQLAQANFDKNAVNRIILATDGDFNVGITDHQELKGYVERQRDKGIFLSVLGFGQGNYNDHLMQQLAQNGNGIAAYIDTLNEAQKVLVNEATSSLFTIAKDVKIQVEFNPAIVSEYRLLGYETRALKREDFNNDKVDAGDIVAGHTVTALYEVTPVNSTPLIEESRYQSKPTVENSANHELGYLKLRYKLPNSDTSSLIETPITTSLKPETKAVNAEVNFGIAVAGFAQLLQGGQYTGQWGYDDALNLAQANKGEDLYGYRTELVQLIRKAQTANGL